MCLERNKNWQIRRMISSSMLILSYTIQQVIPNICTKFQNPRCSSSWEIFDTNFPMYYMGVRDGKKKKMVKINLSILVFCPTIYLATLKVYKKFKDSGSHRSREICNIWLERKQNGQIKETVSIRRLILSYTMQQDIPNICTKFQNPGCSYSWEIFDTNFPMYYIEVRDGKKEKTAKINLSILIFFPTIYLATLKVYTCTKFEDWLSQKPKNLWQKFLLERKKNGQNIAESEQSSHTPGRSQQWYVETICRSKFLIFANWRDRKKKKNNGTSIFWLLVFGVHNRSTLCPCVYQVSTLCASQFLRKERWNFLILENWRERKMKKLREE